MQAFYGFLSAQTRTALRNMWLGNGVVRWFDGLIDLTDPLTLFTSTNEFKMFLADSAPSGVGTVFGIDSDVDDGNHPRYVSPAHTLDQRADLGTSNYMRTDMFSCDTVNNKLRIIVSAGNMQFYFGSAPISATFPSNGVYEISFDSAWNTVTNVTRISDVPPDLYPEYVAFPIPPPVTPQPTGATFQFPNPYTTGTVALTMT